jgi:hypothetical protein
MHPCVLAARGIDSEEEDLRRDSQNEDGPIWLLVAVAREEMSPGRFADD